MLRRARTKNPVLSHVKLKSLITLKMAYVDLSFGFSVNMVLPQPMLTNSGVVKTHQLTYSPAQSLYAFGDRSQCTQHFVVPSKLAKEYLDHFQSRIEEVDIYVDGDKLIWNGFTEGFTGDDSRMGLSLYSLITELLKQPLQTQVSLSTGELDDHQLHEGVHILLSVRDFKVITTGNRLIS